MQNVLTLNARRFLTNFRSETAGNLHNLYETIRRMASTSGTHSGKANRLLHEKSPYLLQHAHNPVDWYPWGDEAFEKAKSENKMIFLSVGYSTCHWCHVMERESFESEEIAKIMNENFVNIKVDREERPDVDKMYMQFVQATTGHGGWPMSVWLTPDLKPVVGGTYFAPESSYGRPGFPTVLQHIAQKWRENNSGVRDQGAKLLGAMSNVSKRHDANVQVLEQAQQCARSCQEYYANSYDPDWGGFGDAPKFPQPSNFEFLLNFYARFEAKNAKNWDESETLKMLDFTLRQMARGGIHDHVAQGFHRYSTDEKWHVPHFEKMLYDQGQLACVFAEMYQITKDDFYAETVEDILTYVDRDLSNADGGFYSAEDADSYPKFGDREKKEGAFCVWTHRDVHKLLPKVIGNDKKTSLADLFCKFYFVKPDGNVSPYQDPHHELTDQNVLIALHTIEKVAGEMDIDLDVARNGLKEARKILFDARLKRPKPHRDTKMLTAWNGLMISGFSRATVALKNASYGNRAEKAIKFIRRHLFDPKSNGLLRSCYADEKGNVVQISKPIQAFADDYAFFIAALLDFYQYSHDDQYVKWAAELQQRMDELFWDRDQKSGYFQCSADDKSILIRQKEDQDGAEPSANSVSALNHVRLYNLLGKEAYKDRAQQILSSYGSTLRRMPFALPKMMCALLAVDSPSTQIVIVGSKDAAEVKAMLNVVNKRFMPFAVTVLLDETVDKWLLAENDHLKSLAGGQKKPTAFVCSNFTCQLPVNTAVELEKLLTK